MIIRIVKMTFKEDKLNDFLDIFRSSKEKILAFKGCRQVQLLKDKHNKYTFFTHSLWDSEAELNMYRNSAVFKYVWNNTKVLFDEPAQAWSLEEA